jgi:hypothetical protein
MANMGRLKHGGTSNGKRTKEYRTWIQIRRRCIKGGVEAFKRYGARGIKLAPEWVDDFEAFANHIGPAPSEKHSIDRIDNTQGYAPGNIRWATQQEQMRNQRRNIYVDLEGEHMLLVDACIKTGVDYFVAYQRIRRNTDPFAVRAY